VSVDAGLILKSAAVIASRHFQQGEALRFGRRRRGGLPAAVGEVAISSPWTFHDATLTSSVRSGLEDQRQLLPRASKAGVAVGKIEVDTARARAGGPLRGGPLNPFPAGVIGKHRF
jgi:hypothetical protein